jgi:hypothetical protein
LQQIEAQNYGGTAKLDGDDCFATAQELIRTLESLPNRVASSRFVGIKFLAWLLFASIVLSCRSLCASVPPDLEVRIQEAQRKFDEAKTPEEYRESGRMFEAIQTTDFQSSAVYFNAGNAYLKGGMMGKAILNFRKAKKVGGGDPYLDANLQLAIRSAPGSLPVAPQPWYTSLLFWTGWTNAAGKLRVGCAGLALSSFVFFLSAVLSSSGIRWVSIVLGLISLVLFTDGALTSSQVFESEQGVIVRETVARKGTGESYAAAFDQPLKDGAEFVILQRSSGWLLGRFEGVGDGWIPLESAAE